MNLDFSILSLMTILVLFFLTSYVLVQKKSKINNAFILILVALVVWNINKFALFYLSNDSWLPFSRILSISWLSIGFLGYNFFIKLIRSKKETYMFFLGITTIIYYLLINFTNLIICEPSIGIAKYKIPGHGFLYEPIIILHIFLPIVYALIKLKKQIPSVVKNIQNGKKIFKLFFIGTIVNIFVILINNVICPILLHPYPYNFVGANSTIIFSLYIIYAIKKYDFLTTNIEDAISEILSGMEEGMILFDTNGTILNYNEKILKIFNIDRSKLSLSYLKTIIPDYDYSEKNIDKQVQISEDKYINLNQNNFSQDKKNNGSILLIKDVTKLVIVEQKLRKSYLTLEKQVKDRTIDLENSSDYSEKVINNMVHGVVIFDENGIITKCNSSFANLLKSEESKILNTHYQDYINPKDQDFYIEKITDLKTSKEIVFESKILSSSGEKIPVNIFIVYLQQKRNNPEFLVSVFDISKRKIAENKLKNSQKTYLKVISNINEAILVLENEKIKYFVNDKIVALSEYTKQELKEIVFRNLFFKDEHNILEHMFSLKSGKSRLIRLKTKQNQTRWIEISMIFTKNSINKDNTLVYLRDMTSRQLVMEQLRENENQFRAFIDQANDFIMIKGIDGKYLKVNDKFLNLINAKESDIIGKTPEELGYSEKFVNQTKITDEQVIKYKNVIIKEKPAKKSAKLKMEWLEETTFPILDRKNKVKYIGIISRDITEKKKSEKMMTRQNKELKKAYRKLQNSYEIMINQEKLASLGTLTAGLAHEINNPTQAIKFSMESLKLNIDDIKELYNFLIDEELENTVSLKDKIKEFINNLDLKTAIEEIEYSATENLKSINRIENIIRITYRLSFNGEEFSTINLKSIINDSLMLTYNRYKSICQVESIVEDDIPMIHGAYQQLEQVFLNLIINARDSIAEKNIPINEGMISIKCYSNLEKTRVIIEISDNGNGIKKEIQKKIFDPFFTTKTVGKGSGLGLNIVHKIIANHDAKIELTSKIEQGTTFILSFPVFNEKK